MHAELQLDNQICFRLYTSARLIIINEYKLTLECKVVTFDEDENGGARVVGEIVNMSADESILDEAGNIDLGKLQPVIFDSAKNEYRVVGEKVGTAWGSGKAIQEREVK